MAFLDLRETSQSQVRRASSLLRRHAAANVLFGQHLQMGLKLAIEVVHTMPEDTAADSRTEHAQPGQHRPTSPAPGPGRSPRNPLPVLSFRIQLLPARPRDGIELRLAIVLRGSPA